MARQWVEEEVYDFTAKKFGIKEALFSGRSEFQSVAIYDTYHYGRMLMNDGMVMVTEKDEFCYHDMIAHVPMFTHPNVKKVLVIGGGDGGTAREVLRHKQVERCVMVEIDSMVVKACKEFIPQTAAVMRDDPRLELRIEDGVAFVKNTKEKFDLVLVDSTDPVGPATPLFNVSFYQDVFNILNDEGLVVSQGESPFFFAEAQKSLVEIFSQVFPLRGLYNFSNLTYPGGLWSFCMGSKKYHPLKDFQAGRVNESGLKFQYYNPSIHCSAFSLLEMQIEPIRQWVNLNNNRD
ncbi:MAG: polyamine aminopropyltransferase [Bdellovibrionaceae bacterium]|nr:polyamine aminopropyltransferase [Pseudobdellovibrionaceae bacterium]